MLKKREIKDIKIIFNRLPFIANCNIATSDKEFKHNLTESFPHILENPDNTIKQSSIFCYFNDLIIFTTTTCTNTRFILHNFAVTSCRLWFIFCFFTFFLLPFVFLERNILVNLEIQRSSLCFCLLIIIGCFLQSFLELQYFCSQACIHSFKIPILRHKR